MFIQCMPIRGENYQENDPEWPRKSLTAWEMPTGLLYNFLKMIEIFLNCHFLEWSWKVMLRHLVRRRWSDCLQAKVALSHFSNSKLNFNAVAFIPNAISKKMMENPSKTGSTLEFWYIQNIQNPNTFSEDWKFNGFPFNDIPVISAAKVFF